MRSNGAAAVALLSLIACHRKSVSVTTTASGGHPAASVPSGSAALVASSAPSAPSSPSAVPLPSAAPSPSAVPLPSAEASEPYTIRPAVFVKYTLHSGEYYGGVNAEPGVVLGPKQQLIKAFDCESKGAPRESIVRVCVGFKSCEAVTPPSAGALAEIACQGPDLHLLLVEDSDGLAFKVREPEHALAQRPMSKISLPPGTRPELGPFLRKNVTAHVDL